jgi:hypothetical protein
MATASVLSAILGFIANLTSYAALIQSIDQDVYEERFDKKRKR